MDDLCPDCGETECIGHYGPLSRLGVAWHAREANDFKALIDSLTDEERDWIGQSSHQIAKNIRKTYELLYRAPGDPVCRSLIIGFIERMRAEDLSKKWTLYVVAHAAADESV